MFHNNIILSRLFLIWIELNLAGINRYTLFPNLDGLGTKFRLDIKGNQRIHYQDWDKSYFPQKRKNDF